MQINDQSVQDFLKDPMIIMQRVEECYVLYIIVKIVLWIPVLVIASIVAFSYYIYNYLFCINQLIIIYHQYTFALILMTIFHLILCFFLTAFYRAIFEDPKSVPQRFVQRVEMEIQDLEEGSIEENIQKYNDENKTDYGYCNKCNSVRPPRAHHCSQCGQCTLKMDHHCPVINNCVGVGNYKFFILMLTYGVVLAGYGVITGILKYIIIGWVASSVQEVQVLISILIAFGMSLTLIPFAGVHYYYVLKNKTTLEEITNQMKRNRRNTGINIYDVGYKNNWIQVFGKRKLFWFLPINTTTIDGCDYPTIYKSEVPRDDYSDSNSGNDIILLDSDDVLFSV